ncbi:MAG: hypothetical protein ABH859_05205 [Pseudomonadota bacterium]
MTPIGHFMSASAVAGSLDLISKRNTFLCFAYYLLFLIIFYVTTLFFNPGPWAMYLHDQFGNVALLFFIIFWGRKDEKKQYFVAILIGAQILSAYTHIFDVLALKLLGEIPTGMWRPHNIMHTPFAALLVSLIVLPVISFLMKNKNFKALYFYLVLGYLLHIFADTITYNYQIYPLWPISSFHFALIDFFQRPEVVSNFLGNPLYIFSQPSVENIDGFIVYQAEVAVNFLLAAFFIIKYWSDRLLKRNP